ncbi:MAC/perforin domain-containing protein [Roseimaritima multifibrata]|nr:MAC/perforin domain-containing protein [Roseimaritima multifibrata]
MPRCPKPKYLQAFVAKKLNASAHAQVAAHVAVCDDCSMVVSQLARGLESPQQPPIEGPTGAPKAAAPIASTAPASGSGLLKWCGAAVLAGAIGAGGYFGWQQLNADKTNQPSQIAGNGLSSSVPTGGSEATEADKQGFVLGNVPFDQPIENIRVTITAGPDAPIDELVDLHLGLGFPLRLQSEIPAGIPFYAALPNTSSSSAERGIPAGESRIFEFSATAPADSSDLLKTSSTLLTGLKVGDIRQIGFAAKGESDWEIAGYKIDVNDQLLASNAQFNKSAQLENTNNQEILTSLLPSRDVLADEVDQLQALIQTGLASPDETRELDDKQQALLSLSDRIQSIGGKFIGIYPSLVEYHKGLAPLTQRQADKRAKRVRVHLVAATSDRAGTKNPLFLDLGGSKLLLSSENSVLEDSSNMQTFELSEADLLNDPVEIGLADGQLNAFQIGVIGSNEPFNAIPDRTALQRVTLEVDDVVVYDSIDSQLDRTSLNEIRLIPPAHRDETGKVVVNAPSALQRFQWHPGLELPATNSDPTVPPTPATPEPETILPEPPAPAPANPPKEDDDDGSPGVDPTTLVNNTTPKGNQPSFFPIPIRGRPPGAGGPQSGGGTPSGGGNVPSGTSLANTPKSRASHPIVEQILAALLAKLNGNSSTSLGNQGPGSQPNQPATGPGSGAVSTTNAATGTPPQITPTDVLEVSQTALTRLQRAPASLRVGMQPVVEWQAKNDDKVKNFQGRLWGIKPHDTKSQPILLAESGKKASAKSLELPSINLADVNIPASEHAKYFVQPELMTFDLNDQVISTGIAAKGPLVPLFPKRSVTDLAPSIFDLIAFQSDSDGLESLSKKSWQKLSPILQSNGADVGYFDEPTGTHIARVFDHLSNSIGISSHASNIKHLTIRFDSQRSLSKNLRVIGHLGFVDAKQKSANDASTSATAAKPVGVAPSPTPPKPSTSKATIEVRLIVRESDGSNTEISPEANSATKELRLETSAPITYTKVNEQTPMMLIDIPISLELLQEDYEKKLTELGVDSLLNNWQIDPKSTLPLKPMKQALVSLTLKLKTNEGEEALGLFGLKIVDDSEQPDISAVVTPTAPTPAPTPPLTAHDETIQMVLGRGYDATKKYADPTAVKNPLFDLKSREDYFYRPYAGGATEINVRSGTDASSYSNSLASNVEAGVGLGLFSASVSVGVNSSNSGSTKTSFVMLNDVLKIYAATLKTKTPLKAALKKIEEGDVRNIIDLYGTHYINEADFGGRISFESYIDETETATTSSIETGVKAAYKIFNAAANVTAKSSTLTKTISENQTFSNYGGGGTLNQQSSIDVESYRDWKDKVAKDHQQALVDFGNSSNGLIPLWKFPGLTTARQAELEQLIKQEIAKSVVHKESEYGEVVKRNGKFRLQNSNGGWIYASDEGTTYPKMSRSESAADNLRFFGDGSDLNSNDKLTIKYGGARGTYGSWYQKRSIIQYAPGDESKSDYRYQITKRGSSLSPGSAIRFGDYITIIALWKEEQVGPIEDDYIGYNNSQWKIVEPKP